MLDSMVYLYFSLYFIPSHSLTCHLSLDIYGVFLDVKNGNRSIFVFGVL